MSTATVSRVFNDESGVSEDTRQHVLDAAAALNYRPHASAQNLARQHTNQIAVVAPVVANYFYMHVMRGIQHALADRDMDLMVHAPANPQDRIHEQPDPESLNTYMARALQPGRNDGILLLSMPLTDEWADRLAETSRAVVLVDGEHPRFESFAVDSREGGYKATQHLIDRGYERIGHITVEYDPPPARTMGARATRTLLRRIEAAGAPPVSSTVFSPELVVRRTCGERPESEAASPGFVLRDQ